MPHKCVACDAEYEDDADVVMTGCACGSKVFQYVRQNGLIAASHNGVYNVNIRKLLNQDDGPPPQDTGVHHVDVKELLQRETLKRRGA